MPNIKYINKLDMLQNSILDFYAHNLIEKKDLERIQKTFEEFDENGDGLLSYQEIEAVMIRMGKKEDTKKVFQTLDYHHSNDISYEEFIKSVMNRKRLEVEENIRKCFDAIDTDKNHHISILELKKVSYINNDPTKEKQFKETFYQYSGGKHYVRLISSILKTL